jgi:hypothetical protein
MERRYSDRVPTEVGVSCRVPASPEKAVLIDLSRSGCRLEFSHRRVDQGATVNLDFQLGQPIGGQVVWTEGAFAGVRFHTALPKPVAVEFGLEPCSIEAGGTDSAPPAPEAQASPQGLLRHWVRRLTDAFA